MTIEDRKTIRALASSAVRQAPVRDDPSFASVRRGRAGSPVLVHAPSGEPAYWLVPFILHDMVCGLAEVSLEGQVTRLGILGATADDRASWVAPEFFSEPPASLLAEIGARYDVSTLSAPLLSYDGSPAKWAWRVQAARSRATDWAIFITPAGWYERQAGAASFDREG